MLCFVYIVFFLTFYMLGFCFSTLAVILVSIFFLFFSPQNSFESLLRADKYRGGSALAQWVCGLTKGGHCGCPCRTEYNLSRG